jgi:hypothetical protein
VEKRRVNGQLAFIDAGEPWRDPIWGPLAWLMYARPEPLPEPDESGDEAPEPRNLSAR